MKLLQFTDIHLFADQNQSLRGVNTHQSWAEVLLHARKHHGDADFIILTGDLSQDESLESYQILNDSLQNWSVPIYWIPGNHDKLHLLQQGVRGGTIRTEKSFQCGAWRIILLDSQHAGQASGFLSTETLSSLKEELLTYKDSPTLIALHHHVLPVGSYMDSIMLENSETFLDLIDSFSQIKVIVSGHVHQAWEGNRNEVAFFTTPSTCYQLTPGAERSIVHQVGSGYRWFELADDARISTDIERI